MFVNKNPTCNSRVYWFKACVFPSRQSEFRVVILSKDKNKTSRCSLGNLIDQSSGIIIISKAGPRASYTTRNYDVHQAETKREKNPKPSMRLRPISLSENRLLPYLYYSL
jgi:hypothetical protein